MNHLSHIKKKKKKKKNSKAKTRAGMLWSAGRDKEDLMQEMYNIEVRKEHRKGRKKETERMTFFFFSLQEIIQSSKKEKNPQILARTADLTRLERGRRRREREERH